MLWSLYLQYEFPICEVPDELDWYPYVSLFLDLLCKFSSSVSGLRKIHFNAYTPLQISTKKSVRKQTRIPIVHVNNFELVSLRFSVP